MSVPEKDGSSSAASIKSPNSAVKAESAEEDCDWVIVKKRKITILIPPIPPCDSQPKSAKMNSIPTELRQTLKKWCHKPASQQPVPRNDNSDGNFVMNGRRISGGLRRPPVGALRVVNRRLRALNLEKKLCVLGGLRSWLLSQGLGRFARVFEGEKLGKYRLVNLTMSELKDMGVDPVGPRRKLLHAIDRLCQPYCLESLQSSAA